VHRRVDRNLSVEVRLKLLLSRAPGRIIRQQRRQSLDTHRRVSTTLSISFFVLLPRRRSVARQSPFVFVASAFVSRRAHPSIIIIITTVTRLSFNFEKNGDE
jgi:hypothetical protein